MHFNAIVDVVTGVRDSGDYDISIKSDVLTVVLESILNRSENPVYKSCKFFLTYWCGVF